MKITYHDKEIPFLDKQEVKQRAEKFLEENWKGGFPVDVDEICDNLSIELVYIPRLKKDFSVDAYITSDFSRIYADDECANGMRNDSRYRFSIAHELGHRVLHAPFYPKNITGLKSCREVANKDFLDVRAEKQANTFAGSLLCPRYALVGFVDEYFGRPFDEVIRLGNQSELGDFLFEMCQYFGISQQTAMIRLQDEFSGVFESYL